MTRAILKGDVQAIDAMVKTLAEDPEKLAQTVAAVDLGLYGSGIWMNTEIGRNGPRLSIINQAPDQSKSYPDKIFFSKEGKPLTDNLAKSAGEVMALMSASLLTDGGARIENKINEEKFRVESSLLNAKQVEQLTTKLSPNEQIAVKSLLLSSQTGQLSDFESKLKTVLAEPQMFVNVARALNELLAKEGGSVQILHTPSSGKFMQFQVSENQLSHYLTYSSNTGLQSFKGSDAKGELNAIGKAFSRAVRK